MKISQTVSNLQSGHKFMMEMAMFNVKKGSNSKSGPTGGPSRVMEHKFSTSCHRALNLCEVSKKYLKQLLIYRADTNTW